MKRKNIHGFTLVEMMVASGITLALLAAIASLFGVGQTVWTSTDTHLQIQSAARIAVARLTEEIRQTNAAHLTVFDNTGIDESDIIRFSVPVICEQGGSFLDSNGDVAYWRAPLTWGCADVSCMDQDEDCSTVEYSQIEYAMTVGGQLVRRVLNEAGNIVAEAIIVNEGVVDFQVSLASSEVSFDIDLAIQTQQGKELTEESSGRIFLRN